jgi:hypothetical protein
MDARITARGFARFVDTAILFGINSSDRSGLRPMSLDHASFVPSEWWEDRPMTHRAFFPFQR